MSDPVQDWLDKVTEKEDRGQLLYKEAPFGFLKLRNGPHKDRTVLKTTPVAKVDGKPVTWFAPGLTWVYLSEVEDCVCIRVFPSFEAL